MQGSREVNRLCVTLLVVVAAMNAGCDENPTARASSPSPSEATAIPSLPSAPPTPSLGATTVDEMTRAVMVPADDASAEEPGVAIGADAGPEEALAAVVEDDEDDERFVFRRELLGRERIGQGPRAETAFEAAIAGLVDPDDAEGFLDEAIVSLVVGRSTYVVVRAQSGRPEFAELRTLEDLCPADQRAALWVARVRETNSPDEHERYERVEAARLMELVVGVLGETAACDAPAEIRARDLDGDREIELTIVVPYAPLGPDAFSDACGVMAFLVGADLNVQAQFLRHFALARMDAGGDYQETEDTTWRIRDIDGDGHADLHVNEVYQMRDEFEGDYAGPDSDGADTNFEARHRTDRRRLEVDCLWEQATDVWNCPPIDGRRLGQSRLWSPQQLVSVGGERRVLREGRSCNSRRSLSMPRTLPGVPALQLLGQPVRAE